MGHGDHLGAGCLKRDVGNMLGNHFDRSLMEIILGVGKLYLDGTVEAAAKRDDVRLVCGLFRLIPTNVNWEGECESDIFQKKV